MPSPKSSVKRAQPAKRAKPSKVARPVAKAKGTATTPAKGRAPTAKGRASTATAVKKGANGKARPRKAPPVAAPVRQRRICTAQDPFGGPCQSSPRPGSPFCTIHSYLERTP